jgi:hypothetical protein
MFKLVYLNTATYFSEVVGFYNLNKSKGKVVPVLNGLSSML